MIGDAAHQAPPSGDGVNQAMLDALELYEAFFIEKFSTLQDAIASFEKKMLKRTAVSTDESLQMAESMLSENNLEYMIEFFKAKDGQ